MSEVSALFMAQVSRRLYLKTMQKYQQRINLPNQYCGCEREDEINLKLFEITLRQAWRLRGFNNNTNFCFKFHAHPKSFV